MNELGIVLKQIAAERKNVWYSVLFGYIGGVTAAGLFAASGYLISKAALLPPVYTLTLLIAFIKVFGLVKAGSKYGERMVSHRATFNILAGIRVRFFEKLEPLAPGIFQKFRSGDLLARITGDVESLQNFFLRVYYPPIVLVFVFLSSMIFTAFYSFWFPLIFAAGLLLTGLLIPAVFALRRQKIEEKVRESRAVLSTDTAEVLYGFRDLKIYQQLNDKEKSLHHSSAAYIANQEKSSSQSMFNQSVNQAAGLLISWGVLAAGVYLVQQGELDGLFLAMLVMLSLSVFENASPMAALPPHLEDSRKASERLNEVTEIKPVTAIEPYETLSDEAPVIRFNDISYTHEGEERPAVNEVSFSIEAGSKTAIVGASGSGKSTIFQLLLGVLRTSEGDIQLQNKQISHIRSEDIWEKSNVVMQENHFFFGTVRDNLQIAREGLTDEEMLWMLEKVSLSRFSLDDPVLEKGENLSGGERQRLAIARVLLRKRSLWLLDEPLSSIDNVTSAEIMRYLEERTEDATVCLISHQLKGLEKMDRIIVMDGGRIAEQGTFTDLMDARGMFYEMKRIEQEILV
ncbi:thiol reductant ABC exporter subunit CydC [Jeotgalibacillus salarius]|uniref:Thiol reductant ABC exporter subunit CydC n=1 Tax=Jeotgalibacillus salarius TaxID=546023 RepID=A0A4Y8LH80_9BACL|nr:thiol reductant ABC exporter subunit CydC [Jeotgalibacillus salarius]TFE02152.1 thiol reductant ABC exporter subunit CydC [Jeotgalibacillus salarius]